MSENEKPRVLKVWCGRRDEAHEQQKNGVRTPLAYIEPVRSGKPDNIPFSIDGVISCSLKVRSYWKLKTVGTKSTRPLIQLKRMREEQEKNNAKFSNDVIDKTYKALWHAEHQRNSDLVMNYLPGKVILTCPVCDTTYFFMLFNDVAEWLDSQIGKSRYISAERLEILSDAMANKLREQHITH